MVGYLNKWQRLESRIVLRINPRAVAHDSTQAIGCPTEIFHGELCIDLPSIIPFKPAADSGPMAVRVGINRIPKRIRGVVIVPLFDVQPLIPSDDGLVQGQLSFGTDGLRLSPPPPQGDELLRFVLEAIEKGRSAKRVGFVG